MKLTSVLLALGVVAGTGRARADFDGPPAGEDPAAPAGDLADLAAVEDVEALPLADLLERPVVAAARYAQRPGDSPTLVSTVDAEDLERFGYRTIGDAMRGVRGVSVSNDRAYTYLGLRGVSLPGDYDTRIALSIDSHRINDGVYGQATPGLELGLPMIAVDRIEVIRGGAWSVYGQNALLGAIQVISASGATRPGLRVMTTARATAETFGDPAGRSAIGWRGQDVQASYGAVSHGFDLFAAASYTFDPGLAAIYTPEFVDPTKTCGDGGGRYQPCDGITRGGDAEEAGSAYLVLRGHGLAFHALGSRRRKREPTGQYGEILGDTSDEIFDDRGYADLEYTRPTAGGELIARIGADHYGYHGTYPYDLPRPGYPTLPASRVMYEDHASSHGLFAEVRYHHVVHALGRYLRDLQLVAGAEAGLSYAQQRAAYRYPEGPQVLFDRDDPDRGVAAFGQASVRAFDHLVAFAAVREDDRVDTFGSNLSPQGGFVLDGGPLGRLRASFARGFRAPSAYERFYGPLSVGLGPEHSTTRELSLERYLGAHLRLQLVAYYLQLRDVITLVRTDTNDVRFVNGAGLEARGLEAEVEGRWGDVRARATYAMQGAPGSNPTVPLQAPRSVAYGALWTSLWGDRARLAVETSYLGARATGDGRGVPPAFLTGINVVVPNLGRGLDLVVGASNLFDERGGDPASKDNAQAYFPRDPRTVWVRLVMEPGR